MVDLFGIQSKKYMTSKAKGAAVDGVRIGQHSKKTRVVVDLNKNRLPAYDVASTDEGLVLVFAKSAESPQKKLKQRPAPWAQ